MREVQISCVLLGLVADLVFTFVGGFALGFAFAASAGSAEAAAARMQEFDAIAAIFVIGFVGTTFGGFVAARTAKQAPLANAVALGVVLLGIGALFGEDPVTAAMPAWYRIACWVLVIPCAVLGAKLAARDRSVPLRDTALAR
ncbi:MAG: hypothetical protein MUF70_09710 [Myxococcota bacterium]|jgi:hypothetical protein|nr:hypothetical protein [Myxococcota bacterium]